MQVSHTTERGGNGADVAARFRRAPMSEQASRVGQVFRLRDDTLEKVSRAQVAAAKDGELFLICVSRENARNSAVNMAVPSDGRQYLTFRALVEERGSTMRFYVEHDGETGNSVKFGPKMWSERVSGTGQSSLMEGFVESADRFYVGVNSSQALKHMNE